MAKPFSFGAIDVRLEAESEPRPARAEDDAPFRILVAADFSGRTARGLVETGAPVGERKAIRVDLDTLDATIARLEPQIRLGDGDLFRFRELDDFLPDTLFARIARFGADGSVNRLGPLGPVNGNGASSRPAPDGEDLAESLSRLSRLHRDGELSDAEFAEAKQQVLDGA